jgi:Domain of unknown function (DUF4258)
VLTSLQVLLRLATLRWLGVFICALATLLSAPSTASALEPAQTKTRVWGFDFAEHNSVGLFRAATPRTHLGNRSCSSELASGSLLAARGAFTLSKHAAEQAAARGITQSQIRVAIEKGAQYSDRLHGTVSHVLNERFASGKTLVVARNPTTDVVTTVIRQTNTFNAGAKLADGTARYVPIP